MKYDIIAVRMFREMFAAEQNWWYANREKNSFALDEEFERVLDLLNHAPWTGRHVENELENVRSIPLKKTHHRIAYEIFDERSTVQLLAIWGSYERRMPKLH